MAQAFPMVKPPSSRHLNQCLRCWCRRHSWVSSTPAVNVAAPFIVLLGVLGYLLNTAFLLVERRLLAWHIAAQRLET